MFYRTFSYTYNYNHFQPLFYNHLETVSTWSDVSETGSGGWIQLLKMARISRCMKIIRRSETLLMIINILVSCGAELGLLGFVWLLGKITKTLVRNALIRYIKPNLNQF